MEAWLALTLGTKIIDILIIIGAIALILFLIAIFIKFVGFKNLKVGEVELSNNPEETDPKKIINENKNLFDHRFFDLIEAKKAIYLYTNKSEITDKEIINMVFLQQALLKCLDDDMYKYIRELEKSDGLVLDSFLQVLNKSINGSKELAKTLKIELNDGSILMGIPEVYISKLMAWSNNHLGFCYDGIQAVINDQFYDSWKNKAFVCMEYLCILLQLLCDDAQLTLSSLNGDLTKSINDNKIKSKK
jgi:hypothetical protein